MIEALRRLGIAARFVTGYLYDAALDNGQVGMNGSGATHAWLQVFLPGAGTSLAFARTDRSWHEVLPVSEAAPAPRRALLLHGYRPQ